MQIQEHLMVSALIWTVGQWGNVDIPHLSHHRWDCALCWYFQKEVRPLLPLSDKTTDSDWMQGGVGMLF